MARDDALRALWPTLFYQEFNQGMAKAPAALLAEPWLNISMMIAHNIPVSNQSSQLQMTAYSTNSLNMVRLYLIENTAYPDFTN